MTDQATGASERHEDRGAVGSPVERLVRPDPFRDWFASLSQEERYNFDSDGRAYKKDAGQMMRMAWNAAAAAERERRDKLGLLLCELIEHEAAGDFSNLIPGELLERWQQACDEHIQGPNAKFTGSQRDD